MPFIWSNNCSTTLAAPITSPSATSCTLTSSANLPTLSAGETYALTFNDSATQSIFEIVYVTAITGAVCTIVRGQEGTAATTWLSGDFAYGAVTAGELADFLTTGAGGSYVDLTTNQTVGGIKTFTSPPVLSGASIEAATTPLAALASGVVDLTSTQTVGGAKTFSVAPVMSGSNIQTGTIPDSAVASIVASLNALVGTLTLESTDGSVTITPSGTTINLAAAIAKCYINGSVVAGQVHFELFSSVALGGSGTTTLSFGAAYTTAPVCASIPITTTSGYLIITAISTTTVSVKAVNSGSGDYMLICVGI